MTTKREPFHCPVCQHNMGRSRCRVIDGKYGVRCNNCKTVFNIEIKPATHSQKGSVDERDEH